MNKMWKKRVGVMCRGLMTSIVIPALDTDMIHLGYTHPQNRKKQQDSSSGENKRCSFDGSPSVWTKVVDRPTSLLSLAK